MKVWQLNSPNNLLRAEAPDLGKTEDKAKIKITKALLSEADMAVYAGYTKAKYPIVLGRFAIGQVTEAGKDSYMKKGDRVYLASVTEDECSPDGLRIAGESSTGFYRDFAAAGADEAYVLPASVSDEAALLIDAVAMAEHVVADLNISVGQHVLVQGGGLYGNVLCQILIYHRAVPILADNNAERLDRAKKSGIYYTFANDETLKTNILQVTGGKLADAAVYMTFANRSEPSALFSLVTRGAYAAYCALTGKPINVNLENALKNGVTVKGITENREFVTAAINILANKAVNFSEFPYRTFREEQLPELFHKYRPLFDDNSGLPDEMDVIKFFF
jgi:threonine dehydrogenase-like Zn-dependent dehydrogenase